MATTAKGHKRTGRKHRWSKKVTEHSDALDLEDNVFKKDDPHEIAASLKKSAKRSRRKKTNAFRSAMSMLNFYINRAGKNLSQKRQEKLEQAKDELRALFGKDQDQKQKKKKRNSRKRKKKSAKA